MCFICAGEQFTEGLLLLGMGTVLTILGFDKLITPQLNQFILVESSKSSDINKEQVQSNNNNNEINPNTTENPINPIQ